MKTDIQFHEDDRARRLLDVFQLPDGQINVSFIRTPGHIVAWHKHKLQTDYWVCLQGSLKVGLFSDIPPWEEGKVKWVYLSDKRQEVLTIKPDIYHGYMALEPNTILMYFTDKKWDPEDEYRKTVGDFNESWSIEEK